MNVNTSRSSEITNITLPGNVSYPANETTVPLNVTILKDMTSPGQTSYNGTITTVPQNTTNVTCPKGPFPSGTSAKNYRFPYPKVDISCYPQNTPLWTLITPDFDSTNAQLCDQCPENYGPDPDCKLQPIPLPGPCCNPGQGCYFVTKLSKREESVLTTGKRGDKRKAVKRFISAAENVLWPE
ncbi:MAG: hypothetical protein M1824_004600 [Vezdaea acicularis]|nr:MAG: hypothetical protein M1824_004600 [Vezdaea acicularis]